MSTEDGAYLLDLSGVKSQLPDFDIRYRDQVDSTNDWAKRVSAKFTGNVDALFLTRHQTSGRGRGDHQWDSSLGSLTFSILMPDPFQLGDPLRSWVALAAGCGICVALESYGVKPALKWPNDVFCQERKLAGVLVESGDRGSLVIGCGINVNNDVSSIKRAINLKDCCQNPVDLNSVLVSCVQEILSLIRGIESTPEPIIRLFDRFDWLSGAPVQWSSGAQSIQGKACGIAPDAALKIMTEAGELRVVSGSIIKLD